MKQFGSIFYTPLIHWVLGKEQPNDKQMIKKVMRKTILKPEKLSNQLFSPMVNIMIFMLSRKIALPVIDMYNSMLFAQKITFGNKSLYFHMEPRQIKRAFIDNEKKVKTKETKNIQFVRQDSIITVGWSRCMDEYFEPPLFSKYNDVISWDDFINNEIVKYFINHAKIVLDMFFDKNPKKYKSQDKNSLKNE